MIIDIFKIINHYLFRPASERDLLLTFFNSDIISQIF